jgi:hypothetical protein
MSSNILLRAVLPALLNTKFGSLGGLEESGVEVKVQNTGIAGVTQEQGVILNENFSFNLRGLHPFTF